MAESRTWVAEELPYVQLGGARLNKRLELLVGALSAKPNASVPEACDSVLELNQWQSLYRTIHQIPLPPEKPQAYAR